MEGSGAVMANGYIRRAVRVVEWVLVTGVAVAAVALLAPVSLGVAVTGAERPRWRAEARWLGCRLRLGRRRSKWMIGPWRGTLTIGAGSRADGRTDGCRTTGGRGWRSDIGTAAAMFRERRVVGRFVRDVWAAVTVSARGEFRYGFDDPAKTAWLHAILCLTEEAGGLKEVYASPDFGNGVWEGHVEVLATVRPYRVLGPVVRALTAVMAARAAEKFRGGKDRWQIQG